MELADPATTEPHRTEAPGVGSFLRERRLALGLTHADVAAVVKLSPRRIAALESERWDELPDGPFLRGFLRNVARALDLDAAALMDRVDASLIRARNPESILVTPGATHAMLPRRNGPSDDRHGGRLLVAGAVVFALAAALIGWSGTDSFDRAVAAGRALVQPSGVTAVATAPVPTSPAASTATPPVVTADAEPRAADADVPAAPTSTAAATTAAVKDVAAAVGLQFHFNEDSWVEVRAADGRVLVKSLFAAGSEQRVEGAAPYSLIVGNAKGVDVRFRGQPVDLGPYTRDQVARLTLS